MTEEGLIGFHVNRSYVKKGTIEQNIEVAKRKLGLKQLKVVQIFLGSPRTFGISLNTETEKSLKIFGQHHGMKIYAHAPYPMVIFSSAVKASTLSFTKHFFNVAARAGIYGIVIHFYKYPRNTVVDTLKKLELNPAVKVMLETPAISPMHALYNTPKELYEVYKEAKEAGINVGICVDTCHIYVTGADIADPEVMTNYMAELVKFIPPSDLLIHLNDSASMLGSGKDHHASLGKGYIWGKSKESLVILLDFIQRYKISTILERNEGNGSLEDDYKTIEEL